jgi:hypothetical protein
VEAAHYPLSTSTLGRTHGPPHLELHVINRLVGDERRANLEGETSFEAIAGEIRQTMSVLCCHKDPCDRGPVEPADDGHVALFRRPVYCISVARPLFDRFFNSRQGYRGAYFRSPYKGLQANDLLMRTLAPGLIASDPSCDGAALGAAFIEVSLTAGSAKAWLTEQNGFCPQCAGEFPPASDDGEIVNGRWELGTSVHSHDGRRAPYLTKIKIMGAFLNDRYDEFIPTRKRARHRDIHEWGWS